MVTLINDGILITACYTAMGPRDVMTKHIHFMASEFEARIRNIHSAFRSLLPENNLRLVILTCPLTSLLLSSGLPSHHFGNSRSSNQTTSSPRAAISPREGTDKP